MNNKDKRIKERLDIFDKPDAYAGIICQEILLNKRVFVERYLPDTKPSLEIIIFVGLNISPKSKYFGFFPLNLCKELKANVSVVYELGCSGLLNKHVRRFTQFEAEEQYIEGLKLVRNFKGKVVIFSHSASTIEHLKLILDDKYKSFCQNIDIAGGILSATVTNIILELKRVWTYYRFFNWKHLVQIGKFIDLPLPIYPYASKAKHATNSQMNDLSIWINTKSSEFFLDTNIKKIILNGKPADYPLLGLIPKHDGLFNPKRQEKVYKYIAKKSKVTVVKCDAEHNLFLSIDTFHILEAIKEYVVRVCG
ncbi:MAG: hypothetical protein HY761_11395 [Candidatus Omnitrophica bacterium]|nr:hypothetical protein [Candidatus Omnitrophota bacterium]